MAATTLEAHVMYKLALTRRDIGVEKSEVSPRR
jgi:hypothetical protein